MTKDIPILGAQLDAAYLEKYRDWMLELPRDLELRDFYSPAVLDSDWEPLTDHVNKLTDGLEGRIGIHGPFVGFTIKSADPLIREVVKKRLDQGLDVCRALDANFMVVHSPFTYWDHYNMPKRRLSKENILEQCHLSMKGAVEKAEDMGCLIVLENIEDLNPEDRLELADSFNSEAVAVSLDTGHAHFAHCSFGGPPVDYYVRSAGISLQHLHLHDVDGHADRHWMPGEGSVPWQELFRALAEQNNAPRLILEVADLELVPASAEWLKVRGLTR